MGLVFLKTLVTVYMFIKSLISKKQLDFRHRFANNLKIKTVRIAREIYFCLLYTSKDTYPGIKKVIQETTKYFTQEAHRLGMHKKL